MLFAIGRLLPAGLLALSMLSCTTEIDSSTGAGGEGANPDDKNCSGKADGAPVCTNADQPAQCQDGKPVVQQQDSCSSKEMFCVDGQCRCAAGDDVKCSGTTVEICNSNGDAYSFYEECESGWNCVIGKKSNGAGCHPPPCQPCPVGGFQCGPDVGATPAGEDPVDTVYHCQKAPNVDCYQWVPTIDCGHNGFSNGCFADPNASHPEELCKNACNVVGVPLNGELCAPAPGPVSDCAVLICAPSGTQLIPDHTDCRIPGQACTKNEECKSCSCVNGQCTGADVVVHCFGNPENCP